MNHRTTPEFWEAYNLLPVEVRARADRAFEVLQADPGHPSLRLKKVGRGWSARVDRNHRALAAEGREGFLWFWIGPHDEYDRLIGLL